MTAVNQDFTMYAGDAAYPQFTTRDGSGNIIDISSIVEIVWTMQRDAKSAPVLSKAFSLGGVSKINSGVGGIFQPNILTGETSALTGYYIHRAALTDGSGNVTTVETGRVRVAINPISSFSGDPALSDRDAVRGLIGDTDSSAWQLLDTQIDFVLTQFPNIWLAAAHCARMIAASYGRRVQKRVGDLEINYGQLQKNYLDLARELKATGDTIGIAPYSGGISHSDKHVVADNTDRVKPPFRTKQFDNPSGANNTSSLDDGWNSDGS